MFSNQADARAPIRKRLQVELKNLCLRPWLPHGGRSSSGAEPAVGEGKSLVHDVIQSPRSRQLANARRSDPPLNDGIMKKGIVWPLLP